MQEAAGIILGMKIRMVEFLDDQESMRPDYDAKSIRLDIYLEDDADVVYGVEVQTENTGELPKRSRYYQSVIDINLIEKGASYKVLKRSYVIFICAFDLFGRGRHIYHFENLCREDTAIRLDDGTEKIFLNIRGTLDDVDIDIRRLLRYFESHVPQDAYTEELEEAVMEAKAHDAWRVEYMRQYARECDLRDEGRAEGKAEGKAMVLISQVCRKIAKGKNPEAIAEDLEENLEDIRFIYDAAVKHAPDYDMGEIYAELEKTLKEG